MSSDHGAPWALAGAVAVAVDHGAADHGLLPLTHMPPLLLDLSMPPLLDLSMLIAFPEPLANRHWTL
jgi:hypothetical protein